MMELGLRGKTALVCASTTGLGLAIARSLGGEGVNVVISGRRGDVATEQAAQLSSAIGIGIDLESFGGARTLFEATVKAFGPPDILVLNSGGPIPGNAREQSVESLNAAFNQLLFPQQELINLSLPHMIERQWGRILAVGSSGVNEPLVGMATSNVGRSALAALLKTLANEVASSGITVNMVLPGRIATDRVASLDAIRAAKLGITPQEVKTESEKSIPAGRYGKPAEFGAVATFLCSESASYITGSQIRVDGGKTRGF